MSEKNKAISNHLMEEVWNNGNLAIVNELVAADYILHDPGDPETRGPEGVRQRVTLYRSAFPDLRFTIEDQIAEGDKVVTRWTARGTHKGELRGIAPTGKHVTTTGISISRIVGGKLVEGWINRDTLGLMQQLGVVRMPERAAR